MDMSTLGGVTIAGALAPGFIVYGLWLGIGFGRNA